MFHPSRGHPQGILIHFASRVNWVKSPYVNIRLKSIVLCYVAKHTTQCSLIWLIWYLHLDKYSVDTAHKIRQYFLRVAPWKLKRLGGYSENKEILTYTIALVGSLCNIDNSIHKYFLEYSIAAGT